MTTLPVVVAILLAVTMPAAQADVSNRNHYANQTLYGNRVDSKIAEAPDGYELDFLETVGRHGARSLTDNKAEKRARALWDKARKAGRLTSAGKGFASDLARFQAAEKKIGYGRLSSVGAAEWAGIGRRTAANYADFFTRAQQDGEQVAFRTTSVYRTKQSAHYLKVSLHGAFPGLDLSSVTTDSRMSITSGSTAKGRASIARGLATAHVRAKARHVLRTLYTASFVRTIKDPVSAALDLYVLYCTAPGMAGETRVTFARYVPAADRATLAQVKDTQNFYRYGPGVAGERSSFRKADPILTDFFSRIDARLKGGQVAAVFRLAHGETTMPFEARIKAPGSQVQQAASRTFTYSRNPWRGFVAGRLAGNIEWAMYTADGLPALVTMRYNEQPVAFRSGCRAADASGLFYSVTELKRCLR